MAYTGYVTGSHQHSPPVIYMVYTVVIVNSPLCIIMITILPSRHIFSRKLNVGQNYVGLYLKHIGIKDKAYSAWEIPPYISFLILVNPILAGAMPSPYTGDSRSQTRDPSYLKPVLLHLVLHSGWLTCQVPELTSNYITTQGVPLWMALSKKIMHNIDL